jgi:hypothetical protein
VLDAVLKLLAYLTQWVDAYYRGRQTRDTEELAFRRKLDHNASDDIKTLVNRNLK